MRKLCAAVLQLLGKCSALPPEETLSDYVTLSRDGAWCWFYDPRAVYIEGKHRRTYAGWVTQKGELQVGMYDHDTGETEYYTLKTNWDIDDHNGNSFLVIPDNRLMVCYARHDKKGLFCRTTSMPENIREWENEITVSDMPRITYSHPVYLSDESRFYIFWRGQSWMPTFASSIDGRNWGDPKILIQKDNLESRDVRPYMKVISDGKAAIHFAFTDGHPRNEPKNSIYYLRYENGGFYKADGAKVGDMNSLPISPNKSAIVYNGNETKVRSWIWDIALDRKGHPIIAYTRLPKETDHRYHYTRWDGDKWVDVEITPAGRWFPQTPMLRREREPQYSGGIALDHCNPSVVYLSRQIRGVFEIEKWITLDNGKTWFSIAITRNSKHHSVRPVIPRGYTGKKAHLLWMHGGYLHYTNYETVIRMLKIK